MSSLRNIPLSYASCSIGCKPSHTLAQKLAAISSAGYVAIELSFPDILTYTEQKLNKPVQPDNFPELTAAAEDIGRLCKQMSLDVMMLQPFANFEGWPKGSVERENAFTRARAWIQLMEACGTDMLQVLIYYDNFESEQST